MTESMTSTTPYGTTMIASKGWKRTKHGYELKTGELIARVSSLYGPGGSFQRWKAVIHTSKGQYGLDTFQEVDKAMRWARAQLEREERYVSN